MGSDHRLSLTQSGRQNTVELSPIGSNNFIQMMQTGG
ncbi:hypothetical protein [Microbulbifer sp. VAAF005]